MLNPLQKRSTIRLSFPCSVTHRHDSQGENEVVCILRAPHAAAILLFIDSRGEFRVINIVLF